MALTWKLPKCPSTVDWLITQGLIYIMECHTAMRINDLRLYSKTDKSYIYDVEERKV